MLLATSGCLGHWPELFNMRANGSSVCTRTIQIDCRADQLNSAFCYILRAPFRCVDAEGLKGKVYVWIGSKSNPIHHELAEQV